MGATSTINITATGPGSALASKLHLTWQYVGYRGYPFDTAHTKALEDVVSSLRSCGMAPRMDAMDGGFAQMATDAVNNQVMVARHAVLDR